MYFRYCTEQWFRKLVQDGEKFILIRNEEQRLKNWANGSDEDDHESSGEEESHGDNFVKTMMISRRVSKMDAVDPAGLRVTRLVL